MFKLSKISLIYVELYLYVNSFIINIIIYSSSRFKGAMCCVCTAEKGSDGFRVATQDNPVLGTPGIEVLTGSLSGRKVLRSDCFMKSRSS